MADKRNCVIELKQYIESLGVQVNVGKNKARGNKGFFVHRGGKYRIDISKNIDTEAAYSTLLHELAHFIHYQNDKTLKSLDFVFRDLSDEEYEELLQVTVKCVPGDFARSLYELKEQYAGENKALVRQIRKTYPDFKASKPCRKIERGLMFSFCLSEVQSAYIKLKSNQKNITRINSKINRLNKYYNQPSELWARFFELFFTDINSAEMIAPKTSLRLKEVIKKNQIPVISDLYRILF